MEISGYGDHNNWVDELIEMQEESEKDKDLGDLHVGKEVSKKQQDSYLNAQGKNERYKGRPDSGTRATESKNHEYKRQDAGLQAEYRNRKEKFFGQIDLADLESVLSPREEELLDQMLKEEAEDQNLSEEESDGNFEFRRLKNQFGEAKIVDETEFSDGWRADGSYSDGYWRNEMTDDEVERLDAEERYQQAYEVEVQRRMREFEYSKTGGGKRTGPQTARRVA
jgi:hypothetical protein